MRVMPRLSLVALSASEGAAAGRDHAPPRQERRPSVSAFTAPRSPMGFSGPAVESRAV